MKKRHRYPQTSATPASRELRVLKRKSAADIVCNDIYEVARDIALIKVSKPVSASVLGALPGFILGLNICESHDFFGNLICLAVCCAYSTMVVWAMYFVGWALLYIGSFLFVQLPSKYIQSVQRRLDE